MPFAEYVPEKATSSGNSLPLIISLHGAGSEKGGTSSELLSSHFPSLITNWESTGLKNIPAIMIAPHLDYKDSNKGWGTTRAIQSIKAIVEYAKEKYNIDTNRVVLIGFSLGGTGVYKVSGENQDLFSSIVVVSSDKTELEQKYIDYYKKIPMKGYSEAGTVGNAMTNCFNSINHSSDLTIYDGYNHGDMPRVSLTEDKNNDGISDLIQWALSQNKSSSGNNT